MSYSREISRSEMHKHFVFSSITVSLSKADTQASPKSSSAISHVTLLSATLHVALKVFRV